MCTQDRCGSRSTTSPTCPTRCRTCLFWELDPVRRAARSSAERGARREGGLGLARCCREWGSCGRVAYVDDEPVGYVIYAPPAYVPGVDDLPDRAGPRGRGAADDHAVRRPGHRGGGLGRLLIQGMARGPDQARRTSARSRRSGHPRRGRQGAAWCRRTSCSRVGFKTQRAAPAPPADAAGAAVGADLARRGRAGAGAAARRGAPGAAADAEARAAAGPLLNGTDACPRRRDVGTGSGEPGGTVRR